MRLIEPVAAYLPYMTSPGNHGEKTVTSEFYVQTTQEKRCIVKQITDHSKKRNKILMCP